MFNKLFRRSPRMTRAQIASARAARIAMLQTPVVAYERRDIDCI